METAILERLLAGYLQIATFGYGKTIGEALWLLKSFITLEIILLGIWMTLSDENYVAVGLSKLLTFSSLSWLLLSWPDLTDTLQRSFIQWGLIAGGGVLTLDDFRKPGNIFAFGAQISVVLLTQMRSFVGWNVLFSGVELAGTGVCTLFILAAFGWMTIQVAVAMLEFYLGSVVAVLLLPFGAFRYLAFLSEKVLGYVLALGIKLAILAFIISLAQFSFVFMSEFVGGTPGLTLSLERVVGLAVAVGFVLVLTIKAPSWVNSLLSGVPALSAGAVAQTALSMGIGVGGMAVGTAHTLAMIGRSGERGIQGIRAVHQAASAGGWAGVGRLGIASAQQLAVNTANRFLHPAAPRLGYLMRQAIPHE